METSTKALVGMLASLAVVSCSAERREVVATRSVTVQEQPLTAPKMIDISIVNLHDETAPDPAQEKVVGTIINDGDRRVSGLSVRINALDRGGNVIRTVTTPPIAQPIDPNGGRATFEAYVPRDPAVAGYHAVAIAR